MLTQQQQTVLQSIQDYRQQQGHQPTLEAIGKALNLARSTIHFHVQTLIKQGYLLESSGKAAYQIPSENKQTKTITLLGIVAAGMPIEAIPNQEELDLAYFYGPNLYALRVSGDSMIEAGILDNDYVIIRKQDTANNGDIAVAMIEQWEVTLKYFYLKGDGQIELRPANRRMQPLIYRGDQVAIQGVMVGLFRNYGG